IEIECGTGDTQALLTDWLDSNAGATATDNCGTITWTNDYGSNDAVQCDNGPITVVFTATDECGNRSITSATYLIKDTEGPNINVEASNLTVECDGTVDPSGALATWLASNGGASATDDCSSVTWSNDFTTLSDECGATGSTTVIFTATDACGNTSNTTATFTIADTTNPTWTNIPTNQTIECDKTIDQNGVFATWLASFSGTDTCGTTTVSNNSVGLSDLCGDTGSETVIFTLTDECGNSIQQTATFTIQDTIAPVLSLPPNVSAQCSDDLTPISFGEATAEDNCDPNPEISYNDVRTDGACSGTYTITRTWTATDACGNVSMEDQIISTSDLTAPEFDQTDLPGNIVVECDGVPEAITLTATDNCGDAVVTVDDIITNGNCDNNYTITRTYTAMDDCGLTKTHVQTITVQDTIPPTFVESLPVSNIVVECDDIPAAQTLSATDICGSAIVTVSDSRTDGTCPNSYTLTRTWTATDECGLTTSHVQNIIVQDTTAPVFVETLPRDTTVECDDIPDVTTMTATDNCGIATVTASDVITNGDCPSNYLIERTWIATDECGLTTSHTQIITVQDTTAPVVTSTYEDTLEVSCTDIPDAPALEFTDNCSSESSLIVVFNETNSFNENVFEDYQIVRTWTVRDECKNEAVFSQTLNVTLDEIYSEIVAEDRCYDDGIFNLNDLISDTLNTNGVWELLEGNPDATLTGSIFDPTVLKLSSDFLPDDGGMDYRFRYTTTHEGCISITEVIMNIHADCVVLPCGENDIKISTALTPNGDGYNDSFDIMGIDLCGFVANVKIFNRWGALVYESSNYTLGSIETSGANGDWNGSAPNSSVGNKSKLPNGTYYYIIKLQNSGLSPITGPLYLGTK
ncbi:MAG: gliding motility-associated C-terminal domain-containing protein, partial [Flaviramulus sp.]